jgi:hypothetical protein
MTMPGRMEKDRSLTVMVEPKRLTRLRASIIALRERDGEVAEVVGGH